MKDFVPRSCGLMDQVREVLRYYHYACSTEISLVFLDSTIGPVQRQMTPD